MIAQGFDGVVNLREFGFGARGVNFFVAQVMQQHRWTTFAAFELWDQVVQALRCAGRDRSPAQPTDRIVALGLLMVSRHGAKAWRATERRQGKRPL